MVESAKLMPEWMKSIQAEVELEEARGQAIAQRNRAAVLLIQAERPKFWQHLIEKLKIATDALPNLKLAGRFSPGIESRGIRISMSHPGLFVSQTHTDLFLDSDCIRCTGLDIGFYNLRFCAVSNSEIAVTDEQGDGHPMDPDQASEYVMRRMIDLLELRKRQPPYSRY
jgi:hypothetical protein